MHLCTNDVPTSAFYSQNGSKSTLNPVVKGQIVLSVNIQYNTLCDCVFESGSLLTKGEIH